MTEALQVLTSIVTILGIITKTLFLLCIVWYIGIRLVGLSILFAWYAEKKWKE